jgi:hypothetical protein
MKNKDVLKMTLLFFYLFYSINSFSQNSLESKSVYKWFDSEVGIGNSELYNGYSYIHKFRTLKGNNEFYLNRDFLKGRIIYDDEVFYDIEMKYDVFSDDVIAKLPNEYSFNYIRLIKDKVKSFTLNNIQFKNFAKNDLKDFPEIKSGFYEILYQSNMLNLFVKHKKNRFEKLDRDYLYNEFKEHESYYVLYNKQWYELSSKTDVINIFEDYKSNIKNFYRANRKLKNENYPEFLKRLVNYINNLRMNKDIINQ